MAPQAVVPPDEPNPRWVFLSEAERDAKRKAKALKKAARQIQRVQNTLRLDERPLVRIAAADELKIRPASAASLAPREQGLSKPMAVSRCGLCWSKFCVDLLPPGLGSITSLDLSHNELSDLPGLEHLASLRVLNLCRNAFRTLPPSLRLLPNLAKLNASRNQLRPSSDFLMLLLQAPRLASLEELDLTFNKKIFTQDLADLLAKELPTVAVRITVTYPHPPGAYVGDAACDRDASLLRSQLEPFTTMQLRRRLVETFGHAEHSMRGPPPEARAVVMQQLLECYAAAGCAERRRFVRVDGLAVASELQAELLVELRAWSARYPSQQERPTIRAQKYMILRSPTEFGDKLTRGSRQALKAKKKHEQNASLWKLAEKVMVATDPVFAEDFTGLAITQGFVGSPHIDTSNKGPFYGLALGDFADGTGGIQVELDPMTVCEVNTKGRLGKVDGRYPHWVAPYGDDCERFSLIFYRTEGEAAPQNRAVFGPIVFAEEEGTD